MLSRTDAPRFLQLIKALDAGWKIDQPVLIRSIWRTSAEASGLYPPATVKPHRQRLA